MPGVHGHNRHDDATQNEQAPIGAQRRKACLQACDRMACLVGIVVEIGDLRKRESQARNGAAGSIQEQDHLEAHHGIQENAENRADHKRHRPQALIHGIHAHHVLFRHEQRHRGFHGGHMERLAHAAQRAHDKHERHRHMAHGNNHAHNQCHGSHEGIGGNEHVLAIEAVGHHAAERGEQALRQHGAQRSEGQHERRIGRFGHKPHACINRGICGKNARRLAEPNNDNRPQPVFRQGWMIEFLHFELLFRHVRYSLYGAPRAPSSLCRRYPKLSHNGRVNAFRGFFAPLPVRLQKPHEGDSLLRRRNIDYKASHAIFARRIDGAVMGRDDLSRNRQTEARPALARGTRVVFAIELFENAFEMLGADFASLVRDFDLERPIGLA